MSVHAVHGVRVMSSLPLTRHPLAAGGAELTVEVGAPRAMPPGRPPGQPMLSFALGGSPVYSASGDGGHTVLRIHGLCDFEMGPERVRAVCHPAPGADQERLALVTRGAFLAFWLALGGDHALHASAVEVDDRAVAFVGDTGIGKSTMAGWACSAGALFITDDLLRLGPGRPPQWIGRSPELRLRAGASELVDTRRSSWQVRATSDGRLAAVPPMGETATGRVAAVVIPQPVRDQAPIGIDRVEPVQAALHLARFSRIQGWCHRRGLETQLDGSSRVADSIPVFVVRVPWGPPFRTETIDDVLHRVLEGACSTAERR